MLVSDLDLICVPVLPAEADAKPVIDPDAVPSRPIALECLQLIAGDRGKVLQGGRRVEMIQLTLRYIGNRLEPSAELAAENLLGILVTKRSDHPHSGYIAARLTSSDKSCLVETC